MSTDVPWGIDKVKTEFGRQYYHQIYPKYADGELAKDVQSFLHGNGRLLKVQKHFFREIMDQYHRHDGIYSPWEFLNSDELLEQYWERMGNGKYARFFSNLEPRTPRAWRLGTTIAYSNVVKCVSNFPVRYARDILSKYCPVGGLYYDPSAGFGIRLSAALLGGFHYIATDPNQLLVPILDSLNRWYRGAGFVHDSQQYRVYCQGSEVFIPELEGKVDFVFTSPPYWVVEVYADDDSASNRNSHSYAAWGRNFVVPTSKNIVKYLKPGGYVSINIKNMVGVSMYDDWRKVWLRLGLEEHEPFPIKVSRRTYNVGRGSTIAERVANYYAQADTELCMVFRKPLGYVCSF